MQPGNIELIASRHANNSRVRRVDLERVAVGSAFSWRLPSTLHGFPPLDEDTGHGTLFLVLAGVSGTAGQVTMPSDRTSLLGSLARAETGVRAGGGPGTQTVPVAVLDEVIPSWIPTVYLLKVDVQGWESAVLAGAGERLRQGSVRYVLYEFSPVLVSLGYWPVRSA